MKFDAGKSKNNHAKLLDLLSLIYGAIGTIIRELRAIFNDDGVQYLSYWSFESYPHLVSNIYTGGCDLHADDEIANK